MTAAPAEGLISHQDLAPFFAGARRSGEWLLRYCPAHADGTKHHGKGGESLGLSDQGVLKCYAGCDFKTILVGLGYERDRPIPSPQPIHVAPERLAKVYEYRDETGKKIAEKARFETPDGRKSFRWRLPGVEGWPSPSGVLIADMPLYGAHLLNDRPNEPVYFVEGEKACEACWDAGLLAVSSGGGAGVRDFGHSLEVLRGRTVLLWADNDPPGMNHMILVQSRLAGIASARPLHVNLPEKGDAYDYFAAGGTVSALEESSPTKATVAVLAEDALRIVVPTIAGPVTFNLFEMEKTSRDLAAEVVVSTFASAQPYSQRMNLLSASARTELRRDLQDVWGKEYGWPQVLNTAFALARETFLGLDRGEDIFDIPDPMGEMFVIPPLLVADGATIVFGDGSSFKSYLAFRMGLCIAMGIPFCGRRVAMSPVMIVDYEDSAPNVRRRLRRLVQGFTSDDLETTTGWAYPLEEVPPAMVYRWPARGIPLRDQVDAIKRKCAKEGIGYLIIDSAAPACGGDPGDGETALAYFRALARIGLPSTTIAHITKGGDTQKPFGSVFWHNEARRTWYIHRVQDEGADEIDLGVYNRKVNDGAPPLPMAFHVSFSGDQGPVRVSLSDINQVHELVDQTVTKNRIWQALTSAMTIIDLVAETGLEYKTVDWTLRRYTEAFVRAGISSNGRRGQPAVLWSRSPA